MRTEFEYERSDLHSVFFFGLSSFVSGPGARGFGLGLGRFALFRPVAHDAGDVHVEQVVGNEVRKILLRHAVFNCTLANSFGVAPPALLIGFT